MSETDEARRKLLKPKLSADDVLAILNEFYLPYNSYNGNKESSRRAEVISELDSYDDANYLIKIDGKKALLKIHNGVESQKYLTALSSSTSSIKSNSIIDLHTSIFRHLAKSEFNVATCQTIDAINSIEGNKDMSVVVKNLNVNSSEHSPQKLVIRLQTWVEGTPLVSLKWFPIETLVDAGAYLGRMCHALDDLAASDKVALETSKRYFAWDGKNLLDLLPYVDHIDNSYRKDIVLSIIDSFRSNILDKKEDEKFRLGIIHGDFNDANIIVSDVDNTGLRVTGAIDFGDTVHSWRVLDITNAMAYALMTSYGKSKRSISAACAILRGFHHTYPLTSDERKHLRLLVACRLALSVTFGNYSFKKNPTNQYILLHSKPAWNSLNLIWDGNGAAIDNAFKIACENITVPAESVLPDCADLCFPDPHIIDPLASARMLASTEKNGLHTSITFVSGNKKKTDEIRRILFSHTTFPFEITNCKLDLPELQGDSIEIAKHKCALAAKEINGAVIVEDTSLCFQALNGLPGPYIKWFLDKNGLDGLNDMISFTEDKSAYAQTIVAFCLGPGAEVITFDGRTQGKIVRPRGKLDFGWDPVFEPDDGNGKTYAEMTSEEKDFISHRKRALVKLRQYIESNIECIYASLHT